MTTGLLSLKPNLNGKFCIILLLFNLKSIILVREEPKFDEAEVPEKFVISNILNFKTHFFP